MKYLFLFLITTNAFAQFTPFTGPSVVATQNTELTTQSANEFVATIDSDGTVLNKNLDWIVGNCSTSIGTGIKSCTMADGIDATTLSCSGMSYSQPDADNINITVRKNTSTTTTNLVVATSSASARVNAKFQLKCTRSTDYRKHATIVGKFENINSSELVKVEYQGNGNQALTANVTDITWSTKVVDNYNTWNGSLFTSPKDTYYIINGKARSGTAFSALKVYVNNVDFGFIGYEGGNSNMVQFTKMLKLNKNDTMSIRSDSSVSLSNIPSAHSLEITELPDTESIIKNLNDEQREIYVFANGTSGHAIGTSATDYPYTTEVEDTHNAYNPTTGVFTAPRSATCVVSWYGSTASLNLSTSQTYFSILTTSDGRVLRGNRANGVGVANFHTSSGAVSLKMQSGQTLKVQSQSSVATTATTSTVDNFITIRCK